MYLPSHRLVGTTFINPSNAKLNPICHLLALLGAHHILHISRIRVNIQSTLRAAPDLCKIVSLAVLIGSNGNSHTFSVQSDMCTCTHFLHTVVRLVGQNKKKMDSGECRVPRKSFRVPFWARVP
jgi:hypothetical protein